MEEDTAIRVIDARKTYGRQVVLNGLNMKVPRGCIYGLLGSSGCGKTTLLRCILGRLNLASGSIVTLGQSPGSKGHGVPGRDVGYMPQELALYGDFTMMETMYYFGILHGMRRTEVKARGRFLLDLLELPPQNKLIRKLSGGQQRRVSFAVAMLQEPPLLILDEPTVGVDPLLRARIWHHLLDLVSTHQTTIVITTHYIDEARQAHVVGLMRDGRLLAESPPDTLIQSHGMATLEDVFLKLCKQELEEDDDMLIISARHSINLLGSADDKSESSVHLSQNSETTPLIQQPRKTSKLKKIAVGVKDDCKQACHSVSGCDAAKCLPRPLNVLALCWKNVVNIYRNLGLLLFQFILPTIQVALFCLAVGRDLHDVNVAYVNADVGLLPGPTPICVGLPDNLGSLYISKLKKGHTLALHQHSSLEGAVHDVREGTAWVAIEIRKNFTLDFVLRGLSTQNGSAPSQAIINGSTIYLYMDVTNAQITAAVESKTLDAYQEFLDEVLTFCGMNTSIVSPPIKVHEPPVYGKLGLSFTDYMGPGILTSITFGISIGLTAIALIIERKQGLIDRTWVAGVNVTEIVISQVITQFFIILVQITLMVVVVIYAFGIYNKQTSNLALIGLLAMLQGLTGMGLGLLISAVCGTEYSALQVALACFYPAILLSGVIWPLEGMPTFLRYISYSLPATFPAEAMRAIMGRGWGISHLEVWRGFAVTIVWFLFFLFVAGIALRIRK